MIHLMHSDQRYESGQVRKKPKKFVDPDEIYKVPVNLNQRQIRKAKKNENFDKYSSTCRVLKVVKETGLEKDKAYRVMAAATLILAF